MAEPDVRPPGAASPSAKLVLVTFAISHTVFEKFDVKQSNDLEICPRSLTVVHLKDVVWPCM